MLALGLIVADKIIAPRRNEILSNGGLGTTRFMEYLERVADSTNSSATAVDEQIVQNLSAAIYALQVQIGSGDLLTSDSDSFTVDSTNFFCDQTEA